MKLKNRKLLINIVGWYGAIAILLAYFLNSIDVISADDIEFQLLNFTGALFISVISIRKKAYQPAFLNLSWTLIALISLVVLVQK